MAFFALKASVLTFVTARHVSSTVLYSFDVVMAGWIIPGRSKVVAKTIAAMTTVHSESANFFATALRNFIEVRWFLDDCLVFMMLAFENQLVINLLPLIEYLDNFEPDVLLSLGLRILLFVIQH